LEAEAKANHERKEAARSNDDDDQEGGQGGRSGDLPRHKVPAYADGTPKPHAQRNFTDPDSRILKDGSGYIQGFNAQAAVDSEAQVIVAHAVTNQPPDTEHFAPMLDRIAETCGRLPRDLSADAGPPHHDFLGHPTAA